MKSTIVSIWCYPRNLVVGHVMWYGCRDALEDCQLVLDEKQKDADAPGAQGDRSLPRTVPRLRLQLARCRYTPRLSEERTNALRATYTCN